MPRPYGKQIALVTGGFGGILSGADDDVQKAMETLDDLDHGDIAGLGDDDHPQYGLLGSAEAVTGAWDFQAALVVSEGNLHVGANDATQGVLNLYGPAAGNSGGRINLYASDDYDTLSDYWTILVYQTGVRFVGCDGNTVWMELAGPSGAPCSGGSIQINKQLTVNALLLMSGFNLNMNSQSIVGAASVTATTITIGSVNITGEVSGETLQIGTEVEIGDWPVGASFALFGNSDLNHAVAGNYALLQQNEGSTYLNAALGKIISCRINNIDSMTISASGIVAVASVTATSFVIGGNTLDTNEWAFLDGLDQALKIADSPTFANVYVPDGGSMGINMNERFVFDAAGLISVAGAHLVLTSTNQVQFGDDGTYIYQSANSILSYVADGRHEFTGGPVYIGTGTPGHTVTGSGDLFVADRLEVDGDAYFDAQRYTYGSAGGVSTEEWFDGATRAFGFRFDYGFDQALYAMGPACGVQLIYTHLDNRGHDHDHVVQTNPTIFVHSAITPNDDNTQWWSIAHDQTNAVYSVGSGIHQIVGGATLGAAATNYAQFAADGELTLAGTARVTESLDFTGAHLERGATAPSEVPVGDYTTWEYGIGDDSIIDAFKIPDAWAVGTDLIVSIDYQINEAYAANNGEVRFQTTWSATPDDETEAIDAPTHSGTLTSADDDIPATARYFASLTIGTISGGSLSAGDEIGLTLSRIALADGSNPTVEPGVVHVHVRYVKDKLGAAT